MQELNDYFAARDVDLFTRLILDTDNVSEAIAGLIEGGHQNCQVLRNAFDDNAPSTVGAAWLFRSLHDENPEGENRDFDLALIASATEHLCPDLDEWFQDGSASLPIVVSTDEPLSAEDVERLDFVLALGLRLRTGDGSELLPGWIARFNDPRDGVEELVATGRQMCVLLISVKDEGTPPENAIVAMTDLIMEPYAETDTTIDLLFAVMHASVESLCPEIIDWYIAGLDAIDPTAG